MPGLNRDPHKPMPRDERGWRVAPAPDGRGMPDSPGDFTDALEKILLGTRRGIVLSPLDRERTAIHESGHALVGMLTPAADPVRRNRSPRSPARWSDVGE